MLIQHFCLNIMELDFDEIYFNNSDRKILFISRDRDDLREKIENEALKFL